MNAEREPYLPFQPEHFTRGESRVMPASVPNGMRLELYRAPIREGHESGVDEWMGVLHDRYDEMLPTLVPERAAFEAIFRRREADGSTWIYHLSLVGERGTGLTDETDIDRTHAAYSRQIKQSGWERLEPMMLLAPAHIRSAIEHWGTTGEE